MEKKLYCGGTILTMDPSQRGDALLVEDGRIRGIGPEAELKGQAAGAEEIRGCFSQVTDVSCVTFQEAEEAFDVALR